MGLAFVELKSNHTKKVQICSWDSSGVSCRHTRRQTCLAATCVSNHNQITTQREVVQLAAKVKYFLVATCAAEL